MDIFTQSILGAGLAQSVAKKEHVKLATLAGLVSGVLADADVFISSTTDPLLALEYHRHFTHSVFFIPLGALAAFILLWPLLRKKLSPAYLYLYCFMGYLLSGFIDACTSYGTHLFWPVSDTRVSWHIISIVDPVFTLFLLSGVVFGIIKLSNRYSRLGLIFAGCYLLIATVQFHRAENSIYELAEQRNHEIEKIIVKPTIGNIILWRSVYLYDDQFYIDAARIGVDRKIYPGTSVNQFSISENMPDLDSSSVLYNDIQRFIHFSDNYVSYYPDNDTVIGDIRYSMSPAGSIPLWGIEMNLSDINQHVKYEFYRSTSDETREQFINMLFGK